MKESLKRYGFRCRMCKQNSKVLHGCEVKYEEKIVPFNLCTRCMRSLGLKEAAVKPLIWRE